VVVYLNVWEILTPSSAPIPPWCATTPTWRPAGLDLQVPMFVSFYLSCAVVHGLRDRSGWSQQCCSPVKRSSTAVAGGSNFQAHILLNVCNPMGNQIYFCNTHIWSMVNSWCLPWWLNLPLFFFSEDSHLGAGGGEMVAWDMNELKVLLPQEVFSE
jgi:hypothetical protein